MVAPACSWAARARGTIRNGIVIAGIAPNGSWRTTAVPSFALTARTTPCKRAAAQAVPGKHSMIETNTIIHGIKPSRLTADERARMLIRRPWTRSERTVVLWGFFGRLSIAIEPILCGLVFAAITVGVFLAPRLSPRWVQPDIIIIAPVFAIGFAGCVVWAIGVMLAPARALFHTLRPIYLVDGYIRYRPRDEHSSARENGYFAVLTEARTLACEWPTLGPTELPNLTRAALCEFSEYGGVHAIDGHPTGVLPARIPALGVGMSPRKREIV
jgi:hypothetical protein